jgi:hypothetical protein
MISSRTGAGFLATSIFNEGEVRGLSIPTKMEEFFHQFLSINRSVIATLAEITLSRLDGRELTFPIALI